MDEPPANLQPHFASSSFLSEFSPSADELLASLEVNPASQHARSEDAWAADLIALG